MNIRLDKNIRTKEDIERPYDEIGIRIKEWRTSNNLKQTEITDDPLADTAYSNLQRMESGRRPPSIELLQYLREKYNVDLNYIICGK